MSQIYALHDSDPSNHPMQRIRLESAQEFNAKGYGIFHTVNEFRGPRQIKNLVRVNAWAVDIDEGTKEAQCERLRAGLVPTMVVETKRGYQAYWAAKDGTAENWNAIVLDRLVPFYGADKNARDLARILRKPGFLHLKNPNEPFMVQKVWEWNVAYTELEMASFYPVTAKNKQAERDHARTRKSIPVSGSFWDRVWHLDCEEALTRLSGHAYVGEQTYSFRRNASGTKNIVVDGKGTSCWIDNEGHIGSLDAGGPTIFNWLNWFHKDSRRVVEMIKEVFPECRTN